MGRVSEALAGSALVHALIAQNRADSIFREAEDSATILIAGAIDVKLLVKNASAEGLEKTEDFKKRMEFIQDRELHNAYFRKHVVDAVTADEVKARYDKEVAALPQEEEIKAAHILVASEDEAKDVIKQLDSGKDFAALAKEKSTDSNKDDGGDLGWFGKGPGDYGSEEFVKAWKALIAGDTISQQPASKHTLQWLVDKYQQSAAFRGLKLSTQANRRNILKKVCENGGKMLISAITRATIAAGLAQRKCSHGSAPAQELSILRPTYDRLT